MKVKDIFSPYKREDKIAIAVVQEYRF
jgi:hypothetical protein